MGFYAYNILRFKKWKFLLFISILCTLLLTKNVVIQNLYPSVTQLAEIHKCPVCYGVSACHDIHKVIFSWHDVSTIFLHLLGVKNVFFGTYNQNKVVLKKLAHSSELEAFDVFFCDKLHLKYPCSNVSKKKLNRHAANFDNLIKETITSDFFKDDSSRLRLCPSTQHIDDLFHNIYLNYKYTDSTEYLIHLWMLLSINPEPLILQILSVENGWPVPKYFGACGRIIIEEYVGLPLTDYYNKPWVQRARIASSLLERSKDWHELQENRLHLDFPNYFAFSSKDICNRHLSDHNYYAICQLLLGVGNENPFPGGFLHDIPIRWQTRNVEYLLQQCAVPNSNDSRIIFGQRLKTSLDTLLRELS
ncbi:PREDICTED: deleted in autism protein 1 homolog isoform X2 [Dinoponera quadriceps]|uniref:Deleted in autism protein 1 homolog isoform X2 n=1 Tax=Dinoponera quadriceps TaxID=609295 RepID=A0A6P3Y0X6_DINQU|nr:PREDICTED: deleted in autism protein 1 homolog isoform X2 [Dinoponera quadriceps]